MGERVSQPSVCSISESPGRLGWTPSAAALARANARFRGVHNGPKPVTSLWSPSEISVSLFCLRPFPPSTLRQSVSGDSLLYPILRTCQALASILGTILPGPWQGAQGSRAGGGGEYLSVSGISHLRSYLYTHGPSVGYLYVRMCVCMYVQELHGQHARTYLSRSNSMLGRHPETQTLNRSALSPSSFQKTL